MNDTDAGRFDGQSVFHARRTCRLPCLGTKYDPQPELRPIYRIAATWARAFFRRSTTSISDLEPVVDMGRQTVSFRLAHLDVMYHVSFILLSDKLMGRRIRTAEQALATFARHRDEFEAAALSKHANQRLEKDGSVFIGSGDLQRSTRETVA